MWRPALVSVVLIGLFGLIPASVGAQGGDNRAALVVRNGNGSVLTKCVAFSEASITGEELLIRSGLSVVINYSLGFGGAVCSINGYGCAFPAQDCWCQCQSGTKCEYWAYYHWIGSAWQYSSVGASGYQVEDGALEGWSWGQGNFTSGTIPPAVTFDQICAVSTATPTPTATATPSPTPSLTPTATQAPTAQATPIPAIVNPPEVLFEAPTSTLSAGACTVLRWVIWDAQQVTLDGATVASQDRREVCPQQTQRYVLIATNSGGETRREVTIAVAGAAGPSSPAANPSATPQPLPGANVHTSPLPTPVAAGAQARGVTPAPAPPAAAARPESKPLSAEAQAQALPPVTATRANAPVAPKAAALAVAEPALGPRPTPTPQSTRLAQRRAPAPGQPTPTPILIARAASSADPSPSQSGNEMAAPTALPERGFRMALLPGYATYALMTAMLVGTGVVVVRRKQHV
jgi:hypothetical protein